ncbi:MAG: hypothetical protein M1561_07210 [Gammaproteobacteria bacterium]|nr:hypothetical protein [Gammaproteobacteria bacterium]
MASAPNLLYLPEFENALEAAQRSLEAIKKSAQAGAEYEQSIEKTNADLAQIEESKNVDINNEVFGPINGAMDAVISNAQLRLESLEKFIQEKESKIKESEEKMQDLNRNKIRIQNALELLRKALENKRKDLPSLAQWVQVSSQKDADVKYAWVPDNAAGSAVEDSMAKIQSRICDLENDLGSTNAHIATYEREIKAGHGEINQARYRSEAVSSFVLHITGTQKELKEIEKLPLTAENITQKVNFAKNVLSSLKEFKDEMPMPQQYDDATQVMLRSELNRLTPSDVIEGAENKLMGIAADVLLKAVDKEYGEVEAQLQATLKEASQKLEDFRNKAGQRGAFLKELSSLIERFLSNPAIAASPSNPVPLQLAPNQDDPHLIEAKGADGSSILVLAAAAPVSALVASSSAASCTASSAASSSASSPAASSLEHVSSDESCAVVSNSAFFAQSNPAVANAARVISSAPLTLFADPNRQPLQQTQQNQAPPTSAEKTQEKDQDKECIIA